MNQFTRFDLPLCMVVEEDVFSHVDETIAGYLPEIRGKKTIIATDNFLRTNYADTLNEISSDFGDAEIYEVADATYDIAAALAKYICMNGIKVIIGFGGGKVLDTAKYAAYVSKAVYISLPTTLSNDSLASPFAVLEMENGGRMTLSCKIPTGILVDTKVIAAAPKSQMLSGIGDTIGKYTAVYDWKLAAKDAGTPIDDFAYSIAWMCYDSVAHCDETDLDSPELVRILSRALVMGGLAMEIAGSSKPSSGSEHLFAHAIEEYHPELRISHGLAVALGCVGAAMFQGRDERKIIDVCKKFGLNLDPAAYGIDKDLFAELWMRAPETRPDRVTILSKSSIDRAWLDQVYERMQG
ncbi:MAG: iron-containing alcohol dehydrogenase family protein [Clostridiales bacterium]|nr:iron-containing alcohol dehydrogenase family protein [Candidatus Blautia equi]